MNKHTATCTNGQIVTHNSKTKTYSHCVVVWSECRKLWFVVGWASRLDLAQNVLNRETNIYHSQIASKDSYMKDYCKRKYGEQMQIKILSVNIA